MDSHSAELDPAIEQALTQMREQIARRIAEVNEQVKSEGDPDAAEAIRKQASQEIVRDFGEAVRQLQQQSTSTETSDTQAKPKDMPKDKVDVVRKTLLTIDEAKKKGIIKPGDVSPKAEAIIEALAKKNVSDSTLGSIATTMGGYLTGQDIVLSTEGQQKSSFERDVELLRAKDSAAADALVDAVATRATDFGLTEEGVRDKFKIQEVESPGQTQEDIDDLRGQDQRREMFSREDQEDAAYFSKFTETQRRFLRNFNSPEKFLKYTNSEYERLRQEETSGHHKNHIRDEIVRSYQGLGREIPANNVLNELIDRKLRIEVSEKISHDLTGVLNHLYWQIQVERPHKFFEEIEKEDFMHGIETIRHHINRKLQKLQSDLEELESQDSPQGEAYRKFKLVKHAEKEHVIEETTKDGKKVPLLRFSPLPYFEDISMSDFVEHLYINAGHWRHRSEYLHNARAIFNHPAHGEKSFYQNLAGYAENLSGTDVDEMMLLPDGQMVFDAYVLYDKFIEEEFASQDWSHRTNQFTNKLERVNTQVEGEVIDHLRSLYPDATEDQLRYAINNAVGLARGVFLTEPEKSAYADPYDISRGEGLFASYATNDATALQTFNPLHVGLRWGGEHLWPTIYFMPMNKNKGMWDHQEMWRNMGKYMDAFYKGRQGLPSDLFVDQLIDVGGVGGLMKRKGWRMTYSLEGHNVRDENGKINYLETFKAMDLIGYEAIFDFLKTKSSGIFSGKSGTSEAAQREDMFKYIFERYFKPFGDTDFDTYFKSLKLKAEDAVNKHIKETGASKTGSYETDLIQEASNMFVDNTLAREVALRFPSKYLRIDRNRLNDKGVSRWQKIQTDMGLSREQFDLIMKDMGFVETLLRREMTNYAKENSNLFPDLKLNSFTKFNYQINSDSIRRLLDGKGFSEVRINNLIKLYEKIKANYLSSEYLDSQGFASIKKYTFTFGIEDTDFTLMGIRGTGPRAIARTIGDTGSIEANVIPGIIDLPKVLNKIAIDGKQDFSPIIEYLLKCQKSITAVHGTGADFAFTYKIAAATINYFKKDAMAKPLFGALRWGRRNSIAAEMAGRSTAVWEWDSRDIDRFVTSLESFRLIPKNPYDAQKTRGGKYIGGEKENIWLINPITKKPIKTPFKRRKKDFEYYGARLRKEFGGDFKAMAYDVLNQFGILVIGFILWKYIQDAMKELEGKKK